MMWKLRFLLFLFFMLWWLGALPGQAADTWRGPDFGPNPPTSATIPEELDRVLELAHFKAPGETLAGTFFPDTGVLVIADREPDGIREGRAIADRHGLAWIDSSLSWSELLETHGATDSDEECEKKIESLCEHHGGSKKSTVKRHTSEETGCITCAGDCASDGAVAFVTETASGCAARKKRDGKKGRS